jgi:hypothetical protein
MLPASRSIVLRRTSKTMRAAVKKLDAVVQVRGRKFRDGQGLVNQLSQALRLPLGEDRRESSLSASPVELDLESNDIQGGGGRALAAALRLCTALMSLNLSYNDD